jgi:KDO2-lipid IV(A) lauroyltransferase
MMFKLFQYRRTVIELNLMHAFPDKTSRELRIIRDKYYRHLAELAAETVKSVSISEKVFRSHIQPHHDALQLLRRYEKSGRHIFVVLGHYGNWEWSALLASLESRLPFYALYQPSGNRTFDRFLVKTRSRFGCQLISNKQLKSLYGHMQKTPSLLAFVADQTPVDIEKAYWTRFMNMKTPFHKGFAALAVKSNAAVLYVTVKKVETGFYELHLNPISEDASLETEEAITEKFVRLLEKDIQNKPAYWLWSHRRWKRAGLSY